MKNILDTQYMFKKVVIPQDCLGESKIAFHSLQVKNTNSKCFKYPVTQSTL